MTLAVCFLVLVYSAKGMIFESTVGGLWWWVFMQQEKKESS